MTFLKSLSEKNIHFFLQSHKTGYQADLWEVKGILNIAQIIEDYFSLKVLDSIGSIHDYVDYLSAKKIRELCQMIPDGLSSDEKVVTHQINEIVNETIARVNNGHVISFINLSISEIFNEEFLDAYLLYNLPDITLDLIARFQCGIKENVFEFLIDQHFHLIIDRYSDFRKHLEGNPELFSRLFCPDRLDMLICYRTDNTFSILATAYNKKNQILNDILTPLIDKIVKDIQHVITSISSENLLEREQRIRKTLAFLKIIKHPYANTLTEDNKNVQAMLTEHLKTNGHRFTYEIPVGEMLQHFKAIPNWILKQLYITHEMKNIDGEKHCNSRLALPSDGKRNLIDFVSSNIPRDDFFTSTHQNRLDITINMGASMISIIWHDEILFEESFHWCAVFLNTIVKKIGYSGYDPESDLEMLYTMVQPVMQSDQPDQHLLRPLCYGASMFICALIEKILRIVYINLMKDRQFIPTDEATLGQLLSPNNPDIVRIFGLDHLKNVLFFLGTVGEKKIGRNYRNSLAHWEGISSEQLSSMFVSQLMYLFTDIVNSLFWFLVYESDANSN